MAAPHRFRKAPHPSCRNRRAPESRGVQRSDMLVSRHRSFSDEAGQNHTVLQPPQCAWAFCTSGVAQRAPGSPASPEEPCQLLFAHTLRCSGCVALLEVVEKSSIGQDATATVQQCERRNRWCLSDEEHCWESSEGLADQRLRTIPTSPGCRRPSYSMMKTCSGP